jgi:hypothetical protein
LALLADRRFRTMAWNYLRLVGKDQKTVMQRAQNLPPIATRQIGTSDRSGKERISRQKKIGPGEMEADAAGGVPRGVDHLCRNARQAYLETVVGGAIWWANLRLGNSQPRGLGVHHGEQLQIVLIEKDGRPGKAPELSSSSDMVDVAMSDDDLLKCQLMLGESRQNLRNIVSGIDHNGFVRDLVSQDRAIALQRADREGFADHASIVILSCKGLAVQAPCSCADGGRGFEPFEVA